MALQNVELYCLNCGNPIPPELLKSNIIKTLCEENLQLRKQLDRNRKYLKIVTIIGLLSVLILLAGLSFQIHQSQINQFRFYYASKCERRQGVADLESYLARWKWTEGAYLYDKFDCSEMAAYLEWRLENEGYHTIIVVGDCPWNPAVKHVWLLVETGEGEFTPVEPTSYTLVKKSNPYFNRYFNYEKSFETIFEALNHNYIEFNWWEPEEKYNWREKPAIYSSADSS